MLRAIWLDFLTLGAFDERDHAVEERLTRIRGDTDLDQL